MSDWRLRRLFTVIYLAFRNLSSRVLRTGLTILGVVIGVGSVVLLLSLGLGLQRLVTQQVVGTKSIKTIDVTSQNNQLLPLNDAAARKITDFPKVQQVIKIYSYAGHVALASANTDTVVYGVNNTYLNLMDLQSATSHPLSLPQANAAIINTTLLQALGITDPAKVIGQKLSLTIVPTTDGLSLGPGFSNQSFVIDGVVTTSAGPELYLPSQVFVNAGASSFSQLKVVVANDTDVPTVRKLIESLGYATTSPYDTLTQITQLFSYFDFILLGFGGIGMVIAVLGMFNTLTISLLERTKEVALMITLGARKRNIRELFLAEGLLLAMLGGALGILLAGVIGAGINLAFRLFAANRGLHQTIGVFYLPVWLMAAAFTFSALLGLVVSIYPVAKAAKIDPVEVLRRG